MIKVLEKAFDLLEYMACDPERSCTLQELAAVTGDATTTCANILKTLCARGYAQREARGRYRIGRMARGMSPYTGMDRRLREAAEEPMQTLAENLGASGVLSVLRANEKRVLARYRSDAVIEVNMELVASNALFSTSTGIILLAARDDDGMGIPDARTRAENAFGSVARYLDILRNVRENGYFYSTSKLHTIEAAAPVVADGVTVAAIGVYYPRILPLLSSEVRTVEGVTRTARKIGETLSISSII
ncbi:MAG: helix-turn-helix domain-containing protein [Clostridiales bacterium]|jgi:DNA-binding IclR family transcriptional regulator|nr:helix-turn-helix domain-containing protein [Clostridiales bacterium]